MLQVNGVGELGAREPQAQFDGRWKRSGLAVDEPATRGMRSRGSEKPPAPSDLPPPRQHSTLRHFHARKSGKAWEQRRIIRYPSNAGRLCGP